MHWSKEQGIEHVILIYNASRRHIIHLYRHRREIFDSFLFVRYEHVFYSLNHAIQVFNFLRQGLDESDKIELRRFVAKSAKIVMRKSDRGQIDNAIEGLIDKYLDRSAHEVFCEITGNHRDYISR